MSASAQEISLNGVVSLPLDLEDVYFDDMVKEKVPASSERLIGLEAKVDILLKAQSRHSTAIWAFAAIAISSLLAMGIWFSSIYLPGIVDVKDNDLKADVKRMSTDVSEMKETFKSLLTLELKRTGIGKGTDLKTNLETSKKLLATAKARGIILDADLISEVGQRLLDEPVTQPELRPVMWDTANEFINYKSFLNAKLFLANSFPKLNEQRATIILTPGTMSGPFVRIQFIEINQTIDWGKWDTVVFTNCTIIYRGGPVDMTNVRFDNCDFQIVDSPEGKQFGKAMLSSVTQSLRISA